MGTGRSFPEEVRRRNLHRVEGGSQINMGATTGNGSQQITLNSKEYLKRQRYRSMV